METDIQEFFKNKNVFLTGGSGFLGKVFIEKVLRSTDVKCIYMLIREKKGMSAEDRIADMFKNELFHELIRLKPNARERITPILGDCKLPKLALSAQDTETLIEQVDIVMHSAATVRFNDPIYTAVVTNVRATRDLIVLAKQMRHLKAFVHVSSAFANCTSAHIDEVYYNHKVTISAKKLLQLAEVLGPELTNRMEREFRGEFPNTYTITKALAEEVVLMESDNLPICIFRPAIVIPIYKEPLAGWVDNYYGPQGLVLGVAHGVLRVIYLRMQGNANLVPVDMCVNLMCAAAWHTAKTAIQSETEAPPPIYNFVPDEQNMLKWQTYRTAIEEYGPSMPITKMAWYPFAIVVESNILYNILIYIYHILPGYLYDFILWLMGRKPMMIDTYRRIHTNSNAIRYFAVNEFTFTMHKTRKLWNSMSPQDQQIFDFDMLSINWTDYFYTTLCGVRKFLSNEGPETIPKAKKLLQRYLILHRATQVLVYGGFSTILSWTLLKFFHYV